MPNRTIYLPDDVEAISRRLGLNLSQITQQAIRALDEQRTPDELEAAVAAASARVGALDLDWTGWSLDAERALAGER